MLITEVILTILQPYRLAGEFRLIVKHPKKFDTPHEERAYIKAKIDEYMQNTYEHNCKTKRAFYIRLKDGTKYPVCKHIKPIFKQEGNKVFVEKWKFKELYKREWVEVTTESIEVEYKKIENKKPWLQKKIYPKPVKMFEMKS